MAAMVSANDAGSQFRLIGCRLAHMPFAVSTASGK
jgi:hypothetical protein